MQAVGNQRSALLRNLGKLAVQWNELEFALRLLLSDLCPEPATGIMLSADFQIRQMMDAIGHLAIEADRSASRVNAALKAAGSNPNKVRFIHLIEDEIDHLALCVDRLREYRNYYIHNSVRATDSKHIIIAGLTARGGVRFYSQIIRAPDLKKLNSELSTVTKYAHQMRRSLARNKATNRPLRPTWPKRPLLPAKLKKPHSTLKDILPPLGS